MKANETNLVGVGINSDKDFVNLVGHKDILGSFSLLLNDDPFGMTELFGFNNLEIQSITPEEVTDYQEILLDSDFSKFAGVVKIEDGILLIEDWFSGRCGIIKGAIDIKNYEQLPELQDAGEVDDPDSISYYEEAVNFF